jgi:hypothetical protein
VEINPYKAPTSNVEDYSPTDHLAGRSIVLLASGFPAALGLSFLLYLVPMSPRTIWWELCEYLGLTMLVAAVILHLYYGSNWAKWASVGLSVLFGAYCINRLNRHYLVSFPEGLRLLIFVAIGLWVLVTASTLLISPAVKSYLAYQKSRRTVAIKRMLKASWVLGTLLIVVGTSVEASILMEKSVR